MIKLNLKSHMHISGLRKDRKDMQTDIYQ